MKFLIVILFGSLLVGCAKKDKGSPKPESPNVESAESADALVAEATGGDAADPEVTAPEQPQDVPEDEAQNGRDENLASNQGQNATQTQVIETVASTYSMRVEVGSQSGLIHVSWSGFPGDHGDWIGLFDASANDTSNDLQYVYARGAAGRSVLSASGLDAHKEYRLVAFRDANHQDVIMTGDVFKVTQSSIDSAEGSPDQRYVAQVNEAPESISFVLENGQLTFNWSNLTPGVNVWIGLIAADETNPRSYRSFVWARTASGESSMPHPNQGRYRLVAFADSGYDKVFAKSAEILVE